MSATLKRTETLALFYSAQRVRMIRRAVPQRVVFAPGVIADALGRKTSETLGTRHVQVSGVSRVSLPCPEPNWELITCVCGSCGESLRLIHRLRSRSSPSVWKPRRQTAPDPTRVNGLSRGLIELARSA